MHGSDGNAPAGKSTKAVSTSTDAPFIEKKISAGNETQSAQTETHLNPYESVPKVAMNLNSEFKEGLDEPVPNNVSQQCASPQIAVCGYDEAPVIRSESLLIADGFIQSRSHFEADQSSEEQVEDDIEPEERWESSPGFDVLVGDKSENLGYDDDAEYLLDLDGEQRELSSCFLGYDFEDPIKYDPTHPDLKQYERDFYDGYDPDDKHLFNNVRRDPGHSRDSMLDSILFRKRKHVPMELTVGDHNGMDLRDHLRRHRVIDGCPITGLSRRHGSSCLIGRSQERPHRHGMGQRLHGRMASEVGMSTIESVKNGTFSHGATANQRGLLRRSQQHRSKKVSRKKILLKHPFSSEVTRKPVTRERRSTQESTTFTGPKTLAQIKEEKKKAEENGVCIWKVGHSSRTTSTDFQAPKTLSEILKDKRKLDFVRDSDNSGY
ncbi:uncharacterized protein LOC142630323 isoform X2 [Castanea sativa]